MLDLRTPPLGGVPAAHDAASRARRLRHAARYDGSECEVGTVHSNERVRRCSAVRAPIVNIAAYSVSDSRSRPRPRSHLGARPARRRIFPYLLCASTNMLDPRAARLIALLTIDILDAFLRDRCHVAPAAISTASVLYNVPVENVVVVGPEMAGGALVAQLAAVCGERGNHTPRALPWCDFAYLRKQRKSSGAKQQLEGPASITERTPCSVPRHAVIVDDALSTGTSLLVRSASHAPPPPPPLRVRSTRTPTPALTRPAPLRCDTRQLQRCCASSTISSWSERTT